MLEYWFKEKRTLVDFRRGLLGPHFDGFAAYLQARGYSHPFGCEVLAKCCQFNGFLLEQHMASLDQLGQPHVDAFLNAYFAHLPNPAKGYSPIGIARGALKHLFDYLVQIKLVAPPKPKRIIKPYSWIVEPYARHLLGDCQFSPKTVKRCHAQISSWLELVGRRVQRRRFQALNAEIIEGLIKRLLQESTDPDCLAGTLRRFFRYCATRRFTRVDFSGLVPSIRRYRHASLPKGLDDSVLGKMLQTIPRETPVGARDYAIIVLMMAYGIRGVSAAQLLLDDVDWQHSRIRIRAQKGGKEVVLPLIHRSFSPRRTRPVPRIYSRQDVSRIMTAALQLGPPGSLRPVVAASLIGLLYSTGIRIGEALNLTLKDLDLKRRVIEIREGKFRKSRYVPVSPSAARHLTKYLRQRRDAGFSTDSTAPVFLNIIGNRHGHPGFVTLFLEVLRSIGLRGPKGQPGPRIHDLRHTFAVHRLLAWYRQGANLGAKLPLLSTYLGHSTITGTEIYLQATAQLLEKAGQRFHAHFTIPPATRDKRHENP